MQEIESTEIAGTEIEIGDILVLPISRQESVSHLEVIGIETTDIETTDDTKVYLKSDSGRYTLSTGDAIAFAVLTSDNIEPAEILAVEKPDELQIAEDQDMPMLEEIDILGGASHDLEAGDELLDIENDTPITVDEVQDDGSVSCRAWRDQRHGQEYHREEWTDEEITTALEDGIFEVVSQ